jgi:hypothetical protein
MSEKINWIKKIEKLLLIIFGLLLFGSLLYASLRPVKDTHITFNVTGVAGSLNATSLVNIHFECIKYCLSHTSNGAQSQYRCYDECSKLGTEMCK